MNKALITGSRGFVGQHLQKLLLDEGWEVHGFNLRDGQDLRNYEVIRNVVDIVRPTHIFHLAGQAYVPESFTNPGRAIEIMTLGSLNLLEAVKQVGLKTHIQMAGTSEEYGDTTDATEPITELSLPNPLSPYAIAKLAMDHLGRLYTKSYGLHVVTTRAFNHTGPGRGEMYAESAFAKQIVEVERGIKKVVEHGNLDSIRNYIDVRDVVRAYKLAVDLEPGVYNICSDQNVSMKHIMNILLDLSDTQITLRENRSLYRPADFSFKKPSCKKFTDLTGWKPEISLQQTLNEILDEWRQKL